jgi:ABC-type bacteriocin/lantibiotic exporter with double-glycine peptidase domain
MVELPEFQGEKLKLMWDASKERIHREQRKRFYTTILQFIVSVILTPILFFFNIIDFFMCISIIIVFLIIPLYVNHRVHKRIQKILDESYEEVKKNEIYLQ